MKKINIYILLGVIALLSGCGQERYDDLKKWMIVQEKTLPKIIDPLPTVKPFLPGSFTSLVTNPALDPFKAKKIVLNKEGPGVPGKEDSRPKDPLEEYVLETLKMIGMMKQNNKTYALVATKEGLVYTLVVGNHLGQNFGKITKIEENKLTIRELIQNSEGVWEEKENILELSKFNAASAGSSTRGR